MKDIILPPSLEEMIIFYLCNHPSESYIVENNRLKVEDAFTMLEVDHSYEVDKHRDDIFPTSVVVSFTLEITSPEPDETRRKVFENMTLCHYSVLMFWAVNNQNYKGDPSNGI